MDVSARREAVSARSDRAGDGKVASDETAAGAPARFACRDDLRILRRTEFPHPGPAAHKRGQGKPRRHIRQAVPD